MDIPTSLIAEQIRNKAQEIKHAAARQVTISQEFFKRLGAHRQLQDALQQAQVDMEDTIKQMDSVLAEIREERKPLLTLQSQIKDEIELCQREIDTYTATIAQREQQIKDLQEDETTTDIMPFGTFTIPRPGSLEKAGVLLMEVAGQSKMLADAKENKAQLMQTQIAIDAKLDLEPVEADPRVVDLYNKLITQKEALAMINDRVLGAAKQSLLRIFTKENMAKIARVASTKIETDLPPEIEQSVFMEAMIQIEHRLTEVLPERALSFITDRIQGFQDNEGKYVTNLIERLKQTVKIGALNTQQEEAFFRFLVQLIVEAMQEGSCLEKVVAELQ